MAGLLPYFTKKVYIGIAYSRMNTKGGVLMSKIMKCMLVIVLLILSGCNNNTDSSIPNIKLGITDKTVYIAIMNNDQAAEGTHRTIIGYFSGEGKLLSQEEFDFGGVYRSEQIDDKIYLVGHDTGILEIDSTNGIMKQVLNVNESDGVKLGDIIDKYQERLVYLKYTASVEKSRKTKVCTIDMNIVGSEICTEDFVGAIHDIAITNDNIFVILDENGLLIYDYSLHEKDSKVIPTNVNNFQKGADKIYIVGGEGYYDIEMEQYIQLRSIDNAVSSVKITGHTVIQSIVEDEKATIISYDLVTNNYLGETSLDAQSFLVEHSYNDMAVTLRISSSDIDNGSYIYTLLDISNLMFVENIHVVIDSNVNPVGFYRVK